jgi:hypothetical protein
VRIPSSKASFISVVAPKGTSVSLTNNFLSLSDKFFDDARATLSGSFGREP